MLSIFDKGSRVQGFKRPNYGRKGQGYLLLAALFLLFALHCSLFTAVASAADVVGKFSKTEGTVDVLAGGALPAVPAKPGDPVHVKDVIRTKSASRAEITFNDGNILKIAQRSRIDISEYMAEDSKGQRVIKLSRGKVQAVVEKDLVNKIALSKGANKFEIHTPNAVAGVRGTDYFVFYDKNITGVVVKDGVVYTYNPMFPDKLVEVTVGNMTTIFPNNPPQPPKPVSGDDMNKHMNDVTAAAQQGKSAGELIELLAKDEGLPKPELPEAPTFVTDTPKSITDIVAPPPITETIDGALNMPPTVTVTPTVLPVADTTYGNLNFVFSSNESPVQYAFNLDDLGWVPLSLNENIANLTGVPEGAHTLLFAAKDEGGLISDIQTLSFSLSRYTLEGVMGDNTNTLTTSVLGDVSAVLNQNWGGWIINMPDAVGTPSANLYAGGPGYKTVDYLMIGKVAYEIGYGGSNGYWLDKMTIDTSTLSGTSALTYLNQTALGTGTGTVTGTLGTGVFNLTDTGYNYTETPLAFVSESYGYTYSVGGYDGSTNAFMGGISSLWTTTPKATMIGQYNTGSNSPHLFEFWGMESPLLSNNYLNDTYTTYDGGAYAGNLFGTEINNAMEGKLYALYIDPSGNAGYLKGSLTGTAYPGIDMFEMTGDITRIQMAPATNVGVPAAELYNSIFSGDGGTGTFSGKIGIDGTITGSDWGLYTMSIANVTTGVVQPWGIFNQNIQGSLTLPSSGSTLTARLGGNDAIGGTEAYIYNYGSYNYADTGSYYYQYQSNNKYGSISYYRPGSADYYIYYYSDGTYSGYDYQNSVSISGTWNPSTTNLSTLATPIDSSNAALNYANSYPDGNNDYGYWIMDATGTVAGNKISGTTTGRYLTHNYKGTMSGDLLGIYEDIDGYGFQAINTGTYNGATKLDFSADVYGGLMYYNGYGGFTKGGDVWGILGGVGNIWTAGTAQVYLMGEYNDWGGVNPYLAYGSGWYFDQPQLEGYEFPIGGALLGYNVGLWKDGGINTKTVSLYISPTGEAGFLTGDLTGNYYSDISMWEMSGNLNKEAKGTTTVPASALYRYSDYVITGDVYSYDTNTDAFFYTLEGTTKVPVDYAEIYADYFEAAFLGIPITASGKDKYIGIWDAGMGGYAGAEGTVPSNAQFKVGAYMYLDGSDGYMLADINTTNFGTTFNGSLSGKLVSPYMYASSMTGDFFGTYDGYYWQAAGVGKWEGTPTYFGGDWYNSTLYDDWGWLSWNSEGSDYGYYGLIKRTDGNYDFHAMGDYYDYGYGIEGYGSPYIWSGSLWDYEQVSQRYLEGFTGGLKTKADSADRFGIMDGYGAAVYYTEDGKAGLLAGSLPGNFYELGGPDYGAWEVHGVLTNTDKTSSLPDGYDTSSNPWISSGSLYAYLGGGFADSSDSYIYGEYYNGKTKFIAYYNTVSEGYESLPFGIYNLKMEYGEYYGKPAGEAIWNAKIGDDGYFGYEYSNYGYWLADISGTWKEYRPEAGYGTIGGTLSGRYITYSHMGTIGGPFYGLYTQEEADEVGNDGYGTWVGLSVGTYEATALTHVSAVGGSIYGYGGYNGHFNALMGGRNSLWTGTPSVIMIGDYYPYDLNPHLWYSSVHSINNPDESYTTYDGGAYYGIIGGRELYNSTTDKYEMEGKLYALYIDSDGNAGYLKGNLTGTAYPEMNMFEMDGTSLTGTQMRTAEELGIGAADLYYSVYTAYAMDGLLAGTTDGGSVITGADNWSFMTQSIVNYSTGEAQPWGIYSQRFTGSFTEPGDTNTTWTAKLGGNDAIGAYYYDSGEGGWFNNDWGYWVAGASGTWTGSKIDGTTSGKFITENKMGTMTGDILGVYDGAGNWTALHAGVFEGDWLKFGASVEGEFPFDESEVTGYIQALFGGTGNLFATNAYGLYQPTPFLSIGNFVNTNGMPLWAVGVYGGVDDDSIYTLDIGGRINAADKTLEGRGIGFYIKSGEVGPYETGILLAGGIGGNAYPDLSMYELTGNLTAVSLGTTGTFSLDTYDGEMMTGNLMSDSVSFLSGGGLTGGANVEFLWLNDSAGDWGVFRGMLGGTDTPGANWATTMVGGTPPDSFIVMETAGTMTDNKMTGKTYGYYADSVPSTGIIVGETIGTFNPTDTIWQALQLGVWMDTVKYLNMAADTNAGGGRDKLSQLNIPAFEVGRANLSTANTGGSTLLNPSLTLVEMNNVVFLAPTSGGTPAIWATGNINGAYSATPNIGNPVTLTGNGLTAQFQPVVWDNGGKWISTINGGGPNSGSWNTGGAPNTGSMMFQGVGAGTITGTTSGTFSGTGAGVVK